MATHLIRLLVLLTLATVAGAVPFTRQPRASETGKVPPSQRPKSGVDAYGDPLPPGAAARLGTVRFRHPGWVQAVAVSPDGKTLFTAGGKVVCVWDIATGKEIRQIRGNESAVNCLALSADGSLLASGSGDKTIRLWDAPTGNEVRRFEGHQEAKPTGVTTYPVSQVVFADDGKSLISAGGDETIRLWDVATGKEQRRFEGHRERIFVIALSTDGKSLAAFCKKPHDQKQPGEVRIWEVASGKTLRHWPLADDVGLWTFSPDLKFLVTCLRGGPDEIKLWDVQSGQVARTLPVRTRQVAFASDGQTLHTGDLDFLRSWDVITGKGRHRIKHPYPNHSEHITLCPDGRTLLHWGFENTIRFTDLATGKGRQFDGHDRGVSAVAFSPDGKLVASGEGEEIRLWSPVTQKQVRRIPGHRSFVTAMTFSPDGKTLLSGSSNNLTHVWDVAGGREIRNVPGSQGTPTAISPNGKVVAACDGAKQGLRLWDVATGKQVLQLAEADDKGHFWSLSFSPDSKLLAAGHLRFARLWEAGTGVELPPLGPHPRVIQHVAFSPDGKLVAAVSWSKTIHLWETATRRQRLVVETGSNVALVAISPDGRHLAVVNNPRLDSPGNADWDKLVLVDVATGKVTRRLAGHRSGVTCVAFSPGGTHLASGSGDTTTLLWDLSTLPRPKPTSLQDGELKILWAALTGEDAASAHRAIWQLAAAPRSSVPFLNDRLRPTPAAEGQVMTRLLNDLGCDHFAVRQHAMRELERLGVAAKPALRKALADNLGLETRRRIELLLARPDSTWTVAVSRSVEVIEHAGNAEARLLLQRLSGGVPDSVLTQEANAALRRLKQIDTLP